MPDDLERLDRMELGEFLAHVGKAVGRGIRDLETGVEAEAKDAGMSVIVNIPAVDLEIRGTLLPVKDADGNTAVAYDPDEGAKVDRSTLRFKVLRFPGDPPKEPKPDA